MRVHFENDIAWELMKIKRNFSSENINQRNPDDPKKKKKFICPRKITQKYIFRSSNPIR